MTRPSDEIGTGVSKRSIREFDEMGRLSPGLRECVHEFGFAIVNSCRQVGINEPRHIRMLVREIWDGARQPMQRNGAVGMVNRLDWLLVQGSAGVSASQLLRYLFDHGFIVVPREPTPPMVDASMDAVNHMGVVSKRQKHHNRLRAAHKAAVKHLWPNLEASP